VTRGLLLLSALLALHAPALGAEGAGASLLAAAAAATGRPPECAAGSRRGIARGPTLWQRARVPGLERYCDLLARGHAQLASNPKNARESARLAEEALPGHAAPSVLLARAELALGSPEQAGRAFARARSLDPRSVEDPSTLHDLARSLARTGQRDEALIIYRALVPRIDLLGAADRRASVLLEAAHASMAAAGALAAGPDGESKAQAHLDEAIAYLREARQRPQTALAGDVLLSLVLVLDRSGDRAQADAALGDATAMSASAPIADGATGGAADGAAGRVRLRALGALAAEEDQLALEALALERAEPAAAIARWEAYLAGKGGRGPWGAAARARIDALRQRSGGGARRPAHGGARRPAHAGALAPGRGGERAPDRDTAGPDRGAAGKVP
jgi:tetratricopeptide (TPR) repeat protein